MAEVPEPPATTPDVGAEIAPRLLYRLQQLDSRLAWVAERLRALGPDAEVEARARAAGEALRAGEDALAATQREIRTLELALQSAVAKRLRVEQDLYAGRVRNPKELAAMQEEVEALKRQARRLEDAILEQMERAEGLLGDLRGLTDAAAAARREWEEREAAATRERAALEAELARLTAARDALAAAIEEPLRRRYERLRERLGGVAVAAARRGICEGCHVALPEARVRRLAEEPETLLTCERCGRILVLADGEA